MNYKFKRNELVSKYSNIKISDKKDHLMIKIRFNDKVSKLKISAYSSIKADLSIFESKVVLIHIFKLIDEFKSDAVTLRKELVNLNYATIFGWI